MGQTVERIQASSLTSGTELCLKKTPREGSNPHARKSIATLRDIFSKLLSTVSRGHRVVIRDEIIPVAPRLERRSPA